MNNKALHESFRVARASRVLVSASRRNELHLNFQTPEESAMTGRHRQRAGRVRYPAGRTNA
jgi:hypothetical protein